MQSKIIVFCCLSFFVSLIYFHSPCKAGELTVVPSIESRVIYDDNLDFDAKDEKDDFGGNVIPKLTLDYQTELLEISLIGELDVIKYFNQTDFDRTNQLYGFDGKYRMFPRWTIAGDFEYIRDENIDSQLEETGEAFQRDRVTTYNGGGGLFYQLTELSDIGFDVDYRKRNYSSSDDTNYDRYTLSMPYKKTFQNQRDIVSLIPAYSIFDSDGEEDAKDYRFGIQWIRQISETLKSTVEGGPRYTEIEDPNGDDTDNWGYFGKLGLKTRLETFTGEIVASRDIRANNDGEIIEVNRLILRADKRILERLGFEFYGRGSFTDTESNNAKDDKVRYFDLNPSLYFLITENTILNLVYSYQNEKELDEPGNPVTERNRAWIGLTIKFPKKW